MKNIYFENSFRYEIAEIVIFYYILCIIPFPYITLPFSLDNVTKYSWPNKLSRIINYY